MIKRPLTTLDIALLGFFAQSPEWVKITGNVTTRHAANRLVAAGLLEQPEFPARWRYYRITAKGIRRAASIKK